MLESKVNEQAQMPDDGVDLVNSFLNRLKNHRKAIIVAQIFLVGGGSAGAALGALGATGFNLNAWVALAIMGIVLGLAGTSFVAFASNHEDNLVNSFQILKRNEEAKQRLESEENYTRYLEAVSTELRSLYLIHAAARGVFEQALAKKFADETVVIETILKSVRSDLRIALGFEMTHTWTIVVYKKIFNDSDGYNYLKCIAHDRSIDCALADARLWREGVGVAGMALARDDQVVAPDILDDAAASLFSLSNGLLRPEDWSRYRSMIAIPVNVGNDSKPWGVVLASSNQPGHFVYEGLPVVGGAAEQYVDRSEAMRALAAITALAVETCRTNSYIEAQRGSE